MSLIFILVPLNVSYLPVGEYEFPFEFKTRKRPHFKGYDYNFLCCIEHV